MSLQFPFFVGFSIAEDACGASPQKVPLKIRLLMRISNRILAPTNYFFPGLRVKILPLLWAVFLFTFLQIPGNIVLTRPALATAVSSSVGTIPGEFAVNGNGGANYTIPIEVPPGINGVQPNISLVYNSQQGNGLLGVGWQLAGFSAIARCGKMIATDGQRGGVNFDSNDRFCFDGQRLMAVNGEYGANETEYRTERETWVKVFSETVKGKNGPRSFTVITKDGHQIEFGKTNDSQVLARGRSDGAIRVWAANKITDRNGNYVEVSYREDSRGKLRDNREEFLGYYPTEIRYTGNSGLNPLRLVKFEYEDRKDIITAYVRGSKAETSKRLASIRTYVDLDSKGNNIDNGKNLVKQYRFTYQDGTATGRSLLTKLEECDSAGTCLPATVFSYEGGQQQFSKLKLLSNNFGYGDDAGEWRINKHPRMMADVNGDGLSDVVGFYNNGVYVALSKGTSFTEPSPWSNNFGSDDDAGEWDIDEHLRMMADVNEDGLSDVVGFYNDGVYVALSKGTSFTEPSPWSNNFGSDDDAGEWDIDKHPRMMADVNGDGLPDVVGFGKKGVNVSFSEAKSDLLTTITNGLGGQTEIEYKPLTNKTVYTKGSGATYPKVDVQAPMFVVSKHTIKDDSTNPTNQFIYEHRYEGAKVDLHRGWLGFEKTTLIDVQNQTETITDFSTDFPLLGMMLGQEIRHNNKVLGRTTSKYESSKDSNGVYKIWKTDLNINYYTEGKKEPEYTLRKEYNYDSEYKNVILISDLADTDPSKDDNVYTCLSYYNSAENDWWKSFSPTQQKIVNSPSACNWESWNPETDLRWDKFEHDEQMNLISRSQYRDKNQLGETQGKWLVSKTNYDTYGNVVSITDPLGNTSTIDYESKYHTFPISHRTPNLKKLSDKPLKVKSTYEPKFGIKTQVIDPNGHKTMEIPKNGIDGFGRILQVKGIKPNSNDMVVVSKTEFKQETNGISVKTWHRTQWNDDPNPNDETWLWQQEYIDGLGRSYKTESKGFDPKTKLIDEVKFNAKGQVEKDYLPYYSGSDKYAINYQYDVRGQVIQVTQPNGAVSKTDYSQQYSDRKLTYQVPDPRDDRLKNNLVKSLVEETTRGWVTEKIAPDESTAYYDYDGLGQVTVISGPLGEQTEMVYNSLGQVLSETTPETGTTKYTYNDNGKLVDRIDAKGQKISFQYDNLGRVIQKQIYQQQSDNNPTKTVTYQYDDPAVANSKGRLTKIIMPEGTYSFAYNNLGEVKEEKVEVEIKGTKKAFVTGYTYDAAGRPDTITYPDGSILRHNYNYQGQLKTIELKEDQARNFTTYATYENYTALGNLGSVSYNNGVASEYQYDEIGRIKQSHTQKGSYSYLQFNYEWNKANKLLRIEDKTDQNLGEIFYYNNVGRLIEATGPYGAIRYNYDKAGNLIKRNDETFKYKPDKKHQLADAEYDANGNTAAYSPWRYTYDSENRLLQVNKIEADSSKNVNKFTYDDSGIRLTKTEADGTTTYYVSPLYELVKQPSGAEVHTKYIVGPQGVVAAISKDGSNISLQNGLNYNSASLETGMYNLGNWGGFGQFFSAKAAQLVYFPNLPRWLFVTIFMTWLLFTLGLWVYHFCRSASRDSWVGKRRGRLLQKLVQLGWLNPSTANQLKIPSLPSWLHGSWYRPWLFILGLVAFTSISLTGLSPLAQWTPGSNGAGYPVAGKTLYFHHGHLGSTSLVTDEQANLVSQINYEPYGEIADSSEGEDNFRPKFTGKEFDSNSDLYYFGARYYNAHLGRFLTPDPARQYFSPYIYGNGDPLSGVDPTGAQFVLLAMIAISALVGGYMGGAAVNHSLNPASWNWKSGKTWAGIFGGAAIGGLAVGAGIAAGGAVAAAGWSTTATVASDIAIAGGVMGTMNASFTAMGGGSIGNIAEAFGVGFGMGALFAVPYLGTAILAAQVGYETYEFIANPSVGNGIQLGMDLLFLGMEAGMRLREGGKSNFEEVGACASFAAETEVVSAEGEKAVEEVAVGDLVWAYNEETGEEGLYPVSHLFTRIAPELVLITAGDEVIEATTEHEFYVDSKGWVEAKDLMVGDKLVQRGGNTLAVTALQSREDSTRVYNFEVDEAHTYYVSEEKLLVHNLRCPRSLGRLRRRGRPRNRRDNVGGMHGNTRNYSARGITESHHFPADNSYRGTRLGNIRRDDMPAVTMTRREHHMTASYGSSRNARAFRDRQRLLIGQGNYAEAMGMDIRDIRSITQQTRNNPNILSRGMVEAINYAYLRDFITTNERTRLYRLAMGL